MSIIPKHLSLVPFNNRQHAALQAIISVEERQESGRRQAKYPYARAMFRVLCGTRGDISSTDLRHAVSNYSRGERGGASKEKYIEALDVLIESRGQICTLPLAGCTVGEYFPAVRYRDSERYNRHADAGTYRAHKQADKAKQQTRRRYQVKVSQAEIELAFITPGELVSWYNRQECRGLADDDLIGMVQSWSTRFSRLKSEAFHTGQPLWSIVDDMEDELEGSSQLDAWLDNLVLPNKLRIREV